MWYIQASCSHHSMLQVLHAMNLEPTVKCSPAVVAAGESGVEGQAGPPLPRSSAGTCPDNVPQPAPGGSKVGTTK